MQQRTYKSIKLLKADLALLQGKKNNLTEQIQQLKQRKHDIRDKKIILEENSDQDEDVTTSRHEMQNRIRTLNKELDDTKNSLKSREEELKQLKQQQEDDILSNRPHPYRMKQRLKTQETVLMEENKKLKEELKKWKETTSSEFLEEFESYEKVYKKLSDKDETIKRLREQLEDYEKETPSLEILTKSSSATYDNVLEILHQLVKYHFIIRYKMVHPKMKDFRLKEQWDSNVDKKIDLVKNLSLDRYNLMLYEYMTLDLSLIHNTFVLEEHLKKLKVGELIEYIVQQCDSYICNNTCSESDSDGVENF
ncbi:hypothetical protein AVEN_153959-1 [Araneus ventricosus]|uniref:Uncharacterized protein n=1 Tax=Araneus ventricosus TaxID=182803 RepID=A0A4Y2EPT7_ARAVE|nr:hypothetical protein AVEN_44761-1 [Araneus ventricosus]GBM30851.1 hypothetical protein AVEN_206279-1 [Araneus ventricosus]GBM30972.1 hypothetical protein AVEN_268150-1 [Araneus ventricosus]GBM31136.1 hypothetical protein AVEN_153959-1 [Araneus ventricosus]